MTSWTHSLRQIHHSLTEPPQHRQVESTRLWLRRRRQQKVKSFFCRSGFKKKLRELSVELNSPGLDSLMRQNWELNERRVNRSVRSGALSLSGLLVVCLKGYTPNYGWYLMFLSGLNALIVALNKSIFSKRVLFNPFLPIFSQLWKLTSVCYNTTWPAVPPVVCCFTWQRGASPGVPPCRRH